MGSFINDINRMTPAAYRHRLGGVIQRCLGAFTLGDAYYVDAANGNDAGSGLQMDQAVKTIQKALTLIANKRTASGKTYDEYIYLLPTAGTDYDDDTVSASLANAYVYINISDVHIIGVNAPHGGSVVIKPDAAATAGIFALGTSADRIEIANITFDTTTAANECIDVPSGGANNVWIHDCIFDGQGGAAAAGIVTANAATCSHWVIENNTFIDCTVAGIKGYLGLSLIRNNRFIKTMTGAMTIGISLLDNTTTADSDGTVIEGNIMLGGIEGTTPLATGISVAAACYGVGIVGNHVSGCTDNLSYTANTAAAHGIFNFTSDGRNGGAEYADSEDKLNS